MSHHTQEFLTLLQYVEINQRNLHQRIVCHVLDAVDMLFAENREFVFAGICLGKNLAIAVISAGLYLSLIHI